MHRRLGHFRKVTRSYWPGLFACYTVPELPRTNNDLEQFFGAYRYHDRRTTGRKVASPGLVLNGSVGIIAAAATRLHPYSAAELAPENVKAWQELRQARETRRQQRTLRRRFRRDPASYLAKLESELTPANFATLVFFNTSRTLSRLTGTPVWRAKTVASS